MTDWAIIENDIVTNVIVADSKEIAESITGKEAVECPRNIGIGCDRVNGVLRPKKPEGNFIWNEETLSWDEVIIG